MPDKLDLHHPAPPDADPSSPLRTRSHSMASDRSPGMPLPLLAAPPDPAYIAASAASQLITNALEPDSFEREPGADDDDMPLRAEPAWVTPAALKLVNDFLDQLLYSFVAAARSTSLAALRPAIAEVLRPTLAREAVAGAEEELQQYLGRDVDEQTIAGELGPDLASDAEREAVWRQARLRCMVYSSLGDMEAEDDEGGATDGVEEMVSPAVAIFLTSILECMAEHVLLLAGQAAAQRRRGKLAERGPWDDGPPSSCRTEERLVVEELDAEKVALDRTCGRLWRAWRKNVRAVSCEANRTRMRQLSWASSSRPSSADPLEPAGAGRASLAGVPEEAMAANIALPMSAYDVEEIEIPGWSAARHRLRPTSLSDAMPRPRSPTLLPLAARNQSLSDLSRSASPRAAEPRGFHLPFLLRTRSTSMPTPRPARPSPEESRDEVAAVAPLPSPDRPLIDSADDVTSPPSPGSAGHDTALPPGMVAAIVAGRAEARSTVPTPPTPPTPMMTSERQEALLADQAEHRSPGLDPPAESEVASPPAEEDSAVAANAIGIARTSNEPVPAPTSTPFASYDRGAPRAEERPPAASGLVRGRAEEASRMEVPTTAVTRDLDVVAAKQAPTAIDVVPAVIDAAPAPAHPTRMTPAPRDSSRLVIIPTPTATKLSPAPAPALIPSAVLRPDEREAADGKARSAREGSPTTRSVPFTASPASLVNGHAPSLEPTASSRDPNAATTSRTSDRTAAAPAARTGPSALAPGPRVLTPPLTPRDPGTPRSRTSDESRRAPQVPPKSAAKSPARSPVLRSHDAGRRRSEDDHKRYPPVASSPRETERSFEQLMESDETIQYTLTSPTMRQIEELQVAPVGGSAAGLSEARTTGWKAAPSAPERKDGLSTMSTSSGSVRSGSGRMARDGRPDHRSTKPIREFVRHTGPSAQREPAPRSPPSRSASLLPTTDGSARRGAPTTVASSSSASAPGSVRRPRLQARAAVVSRNADNPALVEFIRNGPPGPGPGPDDAPWIASGASAVAPLQGAARRPDPLSSPLTAGAAESDPLVTTTSSLRSQSQSHSIDSHTSQTRLLEPPHAVTTADPRAPAAIVPRKQRRVRDPYAIDTDSEGDGDGEAEAEGGPSGQPKRKPMRQEESLMEFLRSVPPPASSQPIPFSTTLSPHARQPAPPLAPPSRGDGSLLSTTTKSSSSSSSRFGRGPALGHRLEKRLPVPVALARDDPASSTSAVAISSGSRSSSSSKGSGRAGVGPPVIAAAAASSSRRGLLAPSASTASASAVPSPPAVASSSPRGPRSAAAAALTAGGPRSGRSEVHGLNDLKDFLKNGPPPPPPSASAPAVGLSRGRVRDRAPSLEKEESGFAKLFRKKRSAGVA
ncbi:MAG: hypothetical protein M1826_003814 [Phylliscum demangeonii]|nr:MAG: hypothetical protein M1826_003814 [Phylliscum demangeonii]